MHSRVRLLKSAARWHVTHGLTGNIVLKVAEGTAKQVTAYLREFFTSSLAVKLAASFARRGPASALPTRRFLSVVTTCSREPLQGHCRRAGATRQRWWKNLANDLRLAKRSQTMRSIIF